MGSGLGFVLGGLLSGVGQGLAQDIADRRAMALQQLRGQQAAESDARQAAAAERADERKYQNQKGLLAVGTSLDIAKENAVSGNRIAEKREQGKIDYKLQGQKIAGERGIAELKGSIDARLAAQKGTIDAGLVRLKSELDGGDVDSVQQTADGRYFIVKKDGSQSLTPYVGAKPGEQGSDDPIARRSGATKPADEPAERPAARPAAPTARPQQKPQGSGRPVLSKGEYQNAINQATRKRNRKEPGWDNLSDEQVRKKLADIYDAAGYDIPSF